MNRRSMKRVTASDPCPVCGKRDWCLRMPDNSAAICARIKSGKPVGKREHSGWLHVLLADTRFEPRLYRKTVAAAVDPPSNINWTKLTETYSNSLTAAKLATFAGELRLSVDSLRQLCVGWSAVHRAWTFPMRDAVGTIIGIRLRRPNGFKFAVTMSKSGLFIPSDLAAHEVKTLCIAEGPTDTAALLDMGLVAVGRPNCSGGVSQILRLVRRLRCREVVIVADGDGPGQVGANALAEELSALTIELRIVSPPSDIKDAREWKGKGATAREILSAPAVTFPHPAIRRAKRHAVQHHRRAK